MNLKYLSVCSGIEAASQAWEPLGWTPVAFSQFDPDHKYKSGPDFASAVLAVHYPDVPNLGDMTKFEEWPDYAGISVLVGGTPCQSYSVAGLREGLDDPRGDLMLTYVAIARRYRPAWVVWENVPGVLSDDGGRSFGTLLGLLTGKQIEVPAGGWKTAGFVEGYKSAYGVAWRVLDSQYVRVDGFGRAVPQRRRRVFVVGYLGNWRRAAAVLFELAGLSGNPPPRRGPAQDVAGTVAASSGRSRGSGIEPGALAVAGSLNASSARRGGVTEGERGGLVPEVSPPIRTGGRRSGGMHGTDADTVDALIPAVSPPLRAGGNTTGGHRPHGTDVDTSESLIPETISMSSGQANAEIVLDGGAPTLTCLHEAPIAAFAFKASHFTRGKDGAPADVFPPLSADADKGDQDPLVCAPDALAFDCKASGRNGFGVGDVAPTLRAMNGGAGTHKNGGGQLAVAQPIPIDMRQASRGATMTNNRPEGSSGGAPGTGIGAAGDPSPTIASSHVPAVAFQPRFARNGRGAPDEVAAALTGEAGRTGKGDSAQVVVGAQTAWRVRRLTPTECERLQGMRDGYTNIPWRGKNGAPDGPRYRALGNSMSVNVMAWIGRRIEMVEEIFADIEK